MTFIEHSEWVIRDGLKECIRMPWINRAVRQLEKLQKEGYYLYQEGDYLVAENQDKTSVIKYKLDKLF